MKTPLTRQQAQQLIPILSSREWQLVEAYLQEQLELCRDRLEQSHSEVAQEQGRCSAYREMLSLPGRARRILEK